MRLSSRRKGIDCVLDICCLRICAAEEEIDRERNVFRECELCVVCVFFCGTFSNGFACDAISSLSPAWEINRTITSFAAPMHEQRNAHLHIYLFFMILLTSRMYLYINPILSWVTSNPQSTQTCVALCNGFSCASCGSTTSYSYIQDVSDIWICVTPEEPITHNRHQPSFIMQTRLHHPHEA